MPCKITVQANGQTLVVSQPVSAVTGTAATAYTTSAVSVARSFPLTITSDTDLWFATDGGTYTVVVSQPDGTQLVTDPVMVSSAVAAVLSPMPTIPQLAADTSAGSSTYGPIVGSDAWLMMHASTPEKMFVGAITIGTGGAVTGAGIVWPDGRSGAYTGVASTASPGSVDGYTVTWVGPTTKTVTQPTVTRDASTGAMTSRPAMVVS